jgi:hypothetical protein
MPDSVSQLVTASLVSGCGAKVLATCSAVQCLPIQRHHCQQSSQSIRKRPTKVWRAWIGDLINESLGMLKVSLAETDSDRHNLIPSSAISLPPLVRHAIALLMKDMVRIFGAGSRTAGRDERGRSHNGEETHFGSQLLHYRVTKT